MRERGWPLKRANSFVHCENAVKLRNVFAMFEPVRKDTERQRLGFCHSLVATRSVRENPRQIGYFSEPTAVIFALNLDAELAHLAILVPLVIDKDN